MTALGLWPGSRLGLSPRRPPTHQASPFSPRTLSGLAFWYDAEGSAVIEIDGAVERWNDLSSHANHAHQPAGQRRPVKATDAEGRDVIRFDGLDDVLEVATPPDLADGVSLLVVFRTRTGVDFSGIVSAAAATGIDHEEYFAFQHGFAPEQEVQLLAKSLQNDPAEIRRPDSGQIQYAIFSISNDGAQLRDLNGQTSDELSDTPFGTPAAFVLGAGLQGGLPFNCGAIDIYEVAAYSRVLTSTEMDELETYCRARHGLRWNPLHIGGDVEWFHDAADSGFALSGGLVSEWRDMTSHNRHWVQSGSARPTKAIDDQDRKVVRFDGVDDVLLMTNNLPSVEPFSVAVVYKVRDHADLAGILTAAPASGVDHAEFWTFRLAASSSDLELFGRSVEADDLHLTRPGGSDVQIAIWTTSEGSAELADADGGQVDTYDGDFGTPAEIVLGGRYDGAPFGFAEIDVMATLGVGRVLSTTDQQRVLDWAASRWGI